MSQDIFFRNIERSYIFNIKRPACLDKKKDDQMRRDEYQINNKFRHNLSLREDKVGWEEGARRREARDLGGGRQRWRM